MKLIHEDCITAMQELIDKGVEVDFILTDPPYGTVKGLEIDGWSKRATEWDDRLDTDKMLRLATHLLRFKGKMILFSQEPYTSELRTHFCQGLKFTYPLYWLKNNFANYLSSKKAPVNLIEDMSVFVSKYDLKSKNPVRDYAQKLLRHIGENNATINRKLGYHGITHFFTAPSSVRFELCSERTYNKLIDLYAIDKLDYFIPYEEMKQMYNQNKPIFNLPDGEKVKYNVFKYKNPYNNYHPTEKPVALLEDLILTYTNKGDTVLDFTMGSGSTGVAAMHTGRDFIGIELNPEYFSIAKQRIGKAKLQKTLEV